MLLFLYAKRTLYLLFLSLYALWKRLSEVGLIEWKASIFLTLRLNLFVHINNDGRRDLRKLRQQL